MPQKHTRKWLILALLTSSLFGYLEWGTGQHALLAEVEWDVFAKLFTTPSAILHPLIILPLLGQMMLILALFPSKWTPWLIWSGMVSIGLLFFFILVIGLMVQNAMIILSALPFSVLTVLTIRNEKIINKKNIPN